MTDANDTLMRFPCDYPIKALGRATEDFDLLVVGIVRKHVPDLLEGAVTTRLSRGDRFVSVTVNVRAENKQQIDNIYLDLTANKNVLVAL
jgi:putative lipoic acid-binding regulatory protein